MSEKSPKVLVVIPARGGSKGIPRKNLRALAGTPLICYSIRTALGSRFKPDVYVSTEDDEIITISRKSGAEIVKREGALATDEVTLDPVIFDVFKRVSDVSGPYDLVVTIQPTSPLLKSATLDNAIETILTDSSIDTIISACDDTHLTWSKADGKFVPNYEKRVNRQYLTPVYKETGSFLITRGTVISEKGRIGKNVSLFLVKGPEAIDIDSNEDWNLCEYYLKRKKILFAVTGYNEVGLGHVYNTLSLANEILNHELVFLLDKKSELGLSKIKEMNYTAHLQTSDNIVDDIDSLAPDLVINDMLDTSEEYIKQLKKKGYQVINFEDLGAGAKHADLVINAMYPEKEVIPDHYFGHKYFCLKNEFYLSPSSVIKEKVSSVLITFGGVDPNNFTLKVLNCIYDHCQKNNIEIHVLAGIGYKSYDTIAHFKGVNIHKNVGNISDFMVNADLIFTSAGRTAFEVAALGVPAIVLCQNERETTHFFASAEYGFINLGLGARLPDEELKKVFLDVLDDASKRKYMNSLMLAQDIKQGKKRVIQLINNIL